MEGKKLAVGRVAWRVLAYMLSVADMSVCFWAGEARADVERVGTFVHYLCKKGG